MPKRLKWADKQQQIYALLDPRDNTMCHVGRIRELKQTGLSPTLLILETIDVSRNASALARAREQYWIQEMLRKGYFFSVFDTTKLRQIKQ